MEAEENVPFDGDMESEDTMASEDSTLEAHVPPEQGGESAEAPEAQASGYDETSPKKWFIIHTYSGFENKVKEDNYLRVERTYGSFSRCFSLPNTVNTEGISAEYKNGVLTVQLPKRAESKPKQVKVNVAGADKN